MRYFAIAFMFLVIPSFAHAESMSPDEQKKHYACVGFLFWLYENHMELEQRGKIAFPPTQNTNNLTKETAKNLIEAHEKLRNAVSIECETIRSPHFSKREGKVPPKERDYADCMSALSNLKKISEERTNMLLRVLPIDIEITGDAAIIADEYAQAETDFISMISAKCESLRPK